MKHEPDGFLEIFVDGVLASLLLAGLIYTVAVPEPP
jgi:hypothetical protein